MKKIYCGFAGLLIVASCLLIFATAIHKNQSQILNAASTDTHSITLNRTDAATAYPCTTTNTTKLGNKLTFYNYYHYSEGSNRWEIYNKSPFTKITKIEVFFRNDVDISSGTHYSYYFGTSIYVDGSTSINYATNVAINNYKYTITAPTSRTNRYFYLYPDSDRVTRTTKIVITYSC